MHGQYGTASYTLYPFACNHAYPCSAYTIIYCSWFNCCPRRQRRSLVCVHIVTILYIKAQTKCVSFTLVGIKIGEAPQFILWIFAILSQTKARKREMSLRRILNIIMFRICIFHPFRTTVRIKVTSLVFWCTKGGNEKSISKENLTIWLLWHTGKLVLWIYRRKKWAPIYRLDLNFGINGSHEVFMLSWGAGQSIYDVAIFIAHTARFLFFLHFSTFSLFCVPFNSCVFVVASSSVLRRLHCVAATNKFTKCTQKSNERPYYTRIEWRATRQKWP